MRAQSENEIVEVEMLTRTVSALWRIAAEVNITSQTIDAAQFKAEFHRGTVTAIANRLPRVKRS